MERPAGPFQIQIDGICLQSRPCKHRVSISGGGWKMMRGTDIYKLLQQTGQKCPHFDYCKEIIRECEQPTPDEIAARLVREAKIKADIERNQKECDERNALVNRTKASSRLDKLRAANSIK